MARPLLRIPLRFRRGTLPTAPALYRRGYSTPGDQQPDPENQQLDTVSQQPEPVKKLDNVNQPPKAPSISFMVEAPEETAQVKYKQATPPSMGFTLDAPELAHINTFSMGKDGLTIEMSDERLNDRSIELSYIRLRENCKCPQCVDVHSRQRNFRISDIPPEIKVRSLNWTGETLEVTWVNDIHGFDSSHVSNYTLREMRSPLGLSSGFAVGSRRTRYRWGQERMKQAQHWISYKDYMHDDFKFTGAMRSLAKLGLIFVKDIPDSREMVEKIATRMGPLRNTFYGPTWDVRKVPEAQNVAYTSQFLGFHMDLMYMNEPPGFQLLHCLRNSCDGGESLFADAFKAAKNMQTHHPKWYERLTKTWLNYHYPHKDNSYSNAWPVFQLASPYEGGEALTHVNYSPPFQGPRNEYLGKQKISYEDQQEELAALKFFAEYLEQPENMFELKLNPGECVIFENRRVVHARRQFNTGAGERWLAGAYVDEDAVTSKFRTMLESHPDAWYAILEPTEKEPHKIIRWDKPRDIKANNEAHRARQKLIGGILKGAEDQDIQEEEEVEAPTPSTAVKQPLTPGAIWRENNRLAKIERERNW
ncbi:hypothetical protein BDW59DRAFT_133143 [Aspergillus cavernicola]|uniref:Clavaminate synthase-like protein n=1 Tax=Aspergillus cavernicola TaxID=176166 RepID=A0ABR4HPX8_9EURO